MIKAIVADLAGTTVDHGSKSPNTALKELFRRFGVEISDESISRPMGMHKRDHICGILEDVEVAENWRQKNGNKHTEKDIDELFAAFLPLQLEILKNYCKLIGNWGQISQELQKQGIKLVVNTGYNREMTDIILAEVKKQGYTPDFSICPLEVSKGRPAPYMIFHAMEHLGIMSVKEVLKIGDSVSDVEEGVNAGCYSVGVIATGTLFGLSEIELNKLSTEEYFLNFAAAKNILMSAGANEVVSSINELPQIINRLNKKNKEK